MNIERLERLLHILRTVDEKHFNMGFWADYDSPDCLTASCAMGHACMDPVFQQQGLRLDLVYRAVEPFYHGEHGYLAAALFFGLDLPDAKRLFGTHKYIKRELLEYPSQIKPKHVIAAIEEFMREKLTNQLKKKGEDSC